MGVLPREGVLRVHRTRAIADFTPGFIEQLGPKAAAAVGRDGGRAQVIAK